MNIGFVSYECPIETGGGGIGTYLSHIVPALISYGHRPVVIAGTAKTQAFWENETIFRIPVKSADDFNNELFPYFATLHKQIHFDIIEATDFQAWGLPIKEQHPEIPFVVKLHTPSFLVDILQYKMNFWQKVRFILGGLKRGQIPLLPRKPHAKEYEHEFSILRKADRLVSTTYSIAQKLKEIGMIENAEIDHVPYCLPISERILKMEARRMLVKPEIIFIGRHEVRKGVIELAKAIPIVLKRNPDAHFTFVGRAAGSPKAGIDMIEYLRVLTRNYRNAIDFVGQVPAEKTVNYLEKGDIFVFPSHYESFGLVCCEALAAGKAVIGSRNGGMAEIIENGKSGILTSPDPIEISAQILYLIKNDAKRLELGVNGRKRILNYYSPASIVEMQIASYEQAILNHNLSSR